VEGLVHISALRDDYYVFDQESMELRGEKSGKIFRLGEKVLVRVEAADPVSKTVDFVLEKEID
jgi:ribonuclease R